MRRTLALVLLIATTWAGSTALGQPAGKAKGEKFALLIGVRSYETPDLRALKYPEADVEELAKVLIKSGYRPENVKLMTQKRGAEEPRYLPIAAKIRKELDLIIGNLDEADSVIVALAGHGVQFKTDEEAYFCPADAQLVDKSSTLISLGTVYDELKDCRAGFKLLMVDACRVNPLTDLGRDAGRTVEEKLTSLSRPLRKKPPGGVAALFSCSTGERAFEHPELEHGVFFHFVIKALEGEADSDADGKVDLDELTNFTRRRVYRFVENKLGVKQNPEFLGKSNSVAIVDLGRPAGALKSLTTQLADLGRPVEASKSLINTLGMKLMLIPAGEFLMGSDASDKDALEAEKMNGGKHRVRITRSFYLGSTEVTVGQFRQFVERSKYRTDAERDGYGSGWNEVNSSFEWGPKFHWANPGFPQTDDHPVTNVTHNDALAFCEWMGKVEGLAYRLPTEAEWEYSCRAGRASRFWSGDDPEGLAAVGNVADGTMRTKFPNETDAITAKDGFVFTSPVGRFPANAFGLFDMHGNVCELCADWYTSDYYAKLPQADPLNSSPPPAGSPRSPLGSSRVIRGGSWKDQAKWCRAAFRSSTSPGSAFNFVGFRMAREQSDR